MEVRLKKLFIALDLVEFENYGEIRIRIRFSPVNSRYYHCLQILFKTPSARYTYMCECMCVCVCVYLVLIAFSQFIRLIRMSFETSPNYICRFRINAETLGQNTNFLCLFLPNTQ